MQDTSAGVLCTSRAGDLDCLVGDSSDCFFFGVVRGLRGTRHALLPQTMKLGTSGLLGFEVLVHRFGRIRFLSLSHFEHPISSILTILLGGLLRLDLL
jgi:hypothetical protein